MLIRHMPPRIPEILRWAVVKKLMLGYPRKDLAVECGISNGAFGTIVNEWPRSVGLDLATPIRVVFLYSKHIKRLSLDFMNETLFMN
jgi:hypothetical protein